MSVAKAFALLGPTASGKTAFALKMAAYLPIEIISLDSALVYRGMDIGTAKPSHAERHAVTHHLIDIITPLETYSAADFVRDCTRLVDEIHARGNLPLIVGGTMMYFHALTCGLNTLPAADSAIRAALQSEKSQYGLAHLYHRLQTVDPATAARLPPTDSQRIERALEVFLLTGKPLSGHHTPQSRHAPLIMDIAALLPESRTLLHERIDRRFQNMLVRGFLNEVQQLQADYPQLNAAMPSMRCVGYRQAWDYLAGSISYDDFVKKGLAATRQLAKRQMTWLRKIAPELVINPDCNQSFQTILTSVKRHFFG